ncbi:ABC-three component system middle component 6 [Corynebacterium mendelii]|uniref:Uncharacterized protein n=1 Tax=Corynebacterium mendelii TaxID=2765362 RepID=A0A939IX40_9CORY|nr:ABC-three component system middle component 6 [Corynebacterium mendelii]MBN9643673.1 hypothetical protein [Corynebacterium mendelii]
MLLPDKDINPDRALLTVGAGILSLLETPATVCELWERYSTYSDESDGDATITFDWFALALSMLFALGVVSFTKSGQLVKHHVSA